MSQISSRDAGNLVLTLLREVHSDHVKRGPAGRILREALNQFDGLSFVAGHMAEEIVIARLHLFAADHGVTFQVISMDHPSQMIPANTQVPDYTVYLIGLDGLTAFGEATDGQLRFRTSKVSFDLRPHYGTRIAIAEGPCPLYSQIIATGVLEPTTSRILVATANGGTRLYGAYQVGSNEPVYTIKRWNPSGLVYCDDGLPCLRERFVVPLMTAYKLTTVSGASTVRRLLDLTVGTALASCDWTRNGALQLVTTYLLVTEAGGIVADMLGLDIGNQYINHWGTTQTAFYVAAGGNDTLEYILTAVPEQLLAP
jgi:hypothetical protein